MCLEETVFSGGRTPFSNLAPQTLFMEEAKAIVIRSEPGAGPGCWEMTVGTSLGGFLEEVRRPPRKPKVREGDGKPQEVTTGWPRTPKPPRGPLCHRRQRPAAEAGGAGRACSPPPTPAVRSALSASPCLTCRTCHHHPLRGPPSWLSPEEPAASSSATTTSPQGHEALSVSPPPTPPRPHPTPCLRRPRQAACCLDIPSPLPLAPLHALTPHVTLPFHPPDYSCLHAPISGRGVPAPCSLGCELQQGREPPKSGPGAWRAAQVGSGRSPWLLREDLCGELSPGVRPWPGARLWDRL